MSETRLYGGKANIIDYLNVSLVGTVLRAHAKGHAQNLPGLRHSQLPYLKLSCKDPDLQSTPSLSFRGVQNDKG